MRHNLSIGSIALAVCFVALSGCSGGNGGVGILDEPTGNIRLTDAANNKPLATSQSNPYLIAGDSLHFTIDATEGGFDGPYTVNIVNAMNVPTASNGGFVYPFTFSQPCFTVSAVATTTMASVPITFSGQNANGNQSSYPSGSAPSGTTASSAGNPCHSGELEEAQISDTRGHSVNFWYEEYP